MLGARYIAVTGEMQKESDVIHVVAHRLDDLTPLLARLTQDLPPIESLARADAVKRPHDENVDRRARGRRNPAQIAAPAARYAGERSRRAGARLGARPLTPRRQQDAARLSEGLSSFRGARSASPESRWSKTQLWSPGSVLRTAPE